MMTAAYALLAGRDPTESARALATIVGSVGVGGFILAGPVIHRRHQNIGRTFASLALRVAGSLLGFATIGWKALYDASEAAYEDPSSTISAIELSESSWASWSS